MYSILRIFLLSGLLVSSPAFIVWDDQLYEGSSCWVDDSVRGVCKKLSDCPTQQALLAAGQWAAAESRRCGFEKFMEIVCCPLPFSTDDDSMPQVALRASEIACERSFRSYPSHPYASAYAGQVAKMGEFPYMVALGYKDTDARAASSGAPLRYTCGGTLISAQHVLTAAHCVSNIHGRVPVEARLGNEDLRINAPTDQRIPISNFVCHPRYQRGTYYNDLAIITLSKEVQFNENVEPICLETKILARMDMPETSTLSVIGFGVTGPDEITESPKLIKVTGLSLVETETCERSYENFAKLPNGLDENMLCALDRNKTRLADACHGDSGGPLLMGPDGVGKSATIIGIIAFGRTCGTTDPSVYMAIHPYLDWIEEQVWQYDDPEEPQPR